MPDGVKSGDVREQKLVLLRFQGDTFGYFLSTRSLASTGNSGRRLGGSTRSGIQKVASVRDYCTLTMACWWSKRNGVKPSEEKERLRLEIRFSGSPIFAGKSDVTSHQSHMRG